MLVLDLQLELKKCLKREREREGERTEGNEWMDGWISE
jgi:hypothetical protein